MNNHERAVSTITRVAAELIRLDNLRDPDMEEFRPVGKREMRIIRLVMHKRGKELAEAITELRGKVRK